MVIDGDRVTPLILDVTGRIRYPAPSSGAVESVTLKVLLRELSTRPAADDGQIKDNRGWGQPEASSFTINECVFKEVGCSLRCRCCHRRRSHTQRSGSLQ